MMRLLERRRAATASAIADDLVDEAVHQIGAGEESRRVAGVVVDIGVQRDVLDMVESVLEHGFFPGAERRHVAAGGSAGRQFDAGVDPLHHLRRLGGDAAVFRGRLRFHLPGPVHLVSEAPELHAVRLLPAVRAAQVGKRRAAGMVAVFEHLARGIGAARARGSRPASARIRPAGTSR